MKVSFEFLLQLEEYARHKISQAKIEREKAAWYMLAEGAFAVEGIVALEEREAIVKRQ